MSVPGVDQAEVLPLFQEFYSVGCTPRKLCCSADSMQRVDELNRHVALQVYVGSNTEHADVCNDGVTSSTAILIWQKCVVESVRCDEERAVAATLTSATSLAGCKQPERSGWADTLLGTSSQLVASGRIKGTSVPL